MPPRKEPKETVTYPASKRKAPPFKPQRPTKALKAGVTDKKPAEDGENNVAAAVAGKAAARALHKTVARKVIQSDVPAKRGTSKQLKAAASRRAGIQMARVVELKDSEDDVEDEEEQDEVHEADDGGDDEDVVVTSVPKKALGPKSKLSRALSPLESDSADEAAFEPAAKKPLAKKAVSAFKSARDISPLESDSEPAIERPVRPRPAKRKGTARDLSPLSDPSPPPQDQPIRIDSSRQSSPPMSQLDTAGIPQPLLVRLMHEAFQNKQTKIDKEAIQVFGKYLEVFVRESLARAAMAKKEDAAAQGADIRGGAVVDDWLEAEDLERILPEMLLDF